GDDARGERADRAGVVVRRAGPSGRAPAGVEGRVGRNGVGEDDGRGAAVAAVRVCERVGDAAAGHGGGSAIADKEGEIGCAGQRRCVGGRVVGGVRIGAVRTVVGDRGGVGNLRHTGRDRRGDGDGEGRTGGTASGGSAAALRAGRAGGVVLQARPAGAAGGGGARGLHRQ